MKEEKLNPFETKKEVTPEVLSSIADMAKKVYSMIEGGGQKTEPSLSKVKDIEKKEAIQNRVNDLLSITEEENLLVWFLAYKEKLKVYRDMTQTTLPELMDGVGVGDMTLDNGIKIKVVDDLKTSLPKANVQRAKHEMVLCELEEVFNDAVSNGLIAETDKSIFVADNIGEVTAMVNARFKEKLVIESPDEETKTLLFDKSIEYKSEETIHAATLKKTVKDMVARGVNVPESISVFEFREAVIK